MAIYTEITKKRFGYYLTIEYWDPDPMWQWELAAKDDDEALVKFWGEAGVRIMMACRDGRWCRCRLYKGNPDNMMREMTVE